MRDVHDSQEHFFSILKPEYLVICTYAKYASIYSSDYRPINATCKQLDLHDIDSSHLRKYIRKLCHCRKLYHVDGNDFCVDVIINGGDDRLL